MKEGVEQFIKKLIEHFESSKLPLAARILWVNDNYDAFLLKEYQWFERYQTVDETGSTTMRYFLKQVPTYVQKEQEEEEKKRKEKEKQEKKKKLPSTNEQILQQVLSHQLVVPDKYKPEEEEIPQAESAQEEERP